MIMIVKTPGSRQATLMLIVLLGLASVFLLCHVMARGLSVRFKTKMQPLSVPLNVTIFLSEQAVFEETGRHNRNRSEHVTNFGFVTARRQKIKAITLACDTHAISNDKGAFCWNTQGIKTFAQFRAYRQDNFRPDFAQAVADTINMFWPNARSIGDFGASSGNYVRFYMKEGFSSHGYDGTSSIDELSHGAVEHLNLAIQIQDDAQFVPVYDVVTCLEVGEHIPHVHSEVFLQNIVSKARDALFLTWAPVGQPSNGHVNCQSAEFVRELVGRKGLTLHKEATEFVRKGGGNRDSKHLFQNVQVFVTSKISLNSSLHHTTPSESVTGVGL